MGQVLRDMDKQQSLIDEAIRINALAEDNDVAPLNLGPLARMSVQASLRKLSEKLSEVTVVLGGEPLPPIGPLKDYGAAIITLNTNIIAAEVMNDADKVPEQFTFTDVTDADPETEYESDAIVVSGIEAAAAMTITGGEYQIEGGTWASAATTIENGASIKVRATSSAEFETAVNVVLTIGGVSDTFTITTASEGGGGGYVAPAITFAANADLAHGGSPLTGVVDGPTGFVSLWVKPDPLSGGVDFARALGGNFEMRVESGGELQVYFYDENAENFAEIRAAGALSFADWDHLLIAWDMGHAIGDRLIAAYLNDSPLTIVYDSEDGASINIDYTANNFEFLVNGNSNRAENFSDSGLWLGSSIVEADGTISLVNRRKFIDGSGKPVDPVNWPANPVLKFSGDASAFATNQGSGGAFVLTGSIDDAATSPSNP